MSASVWWCESHRASGEETHCWRAVARPEILYDNHPCRMTKRTLIAPDVLVAVGLAALAWLHEHDLGVHAELMDSSIDRDALAAALDALEGQPGIAGSSQP